jgi:hypothetical protein
MLDYTFFTDSLLSSNQFYGFYGRAIALLLVVMDGGYTGTGWDVPFLSLALLLSSIYWRGVSGAFFVLVSARHVCLSVVTVFLFFVFPYLILSSGAELLAAFSSREDNGYDVTLIVSKQ